MTTLRIQSEVTFLREPPSDELAAEVQAALNAALNDVLARHGHISTDQNWIGVEATKKQEN